MEEKKYLCVPSKGKGICEHGKRKAQCRECVGAPLFANTGNSNTLAKTAADLQFVNTANEKRSAENVEDPLSVNTGNSNTLAKTVNTESKECKK